MRKVSLMTKVLVAVVGLIAAVMGERVITNGNKPETRPASSQAGALSGVPSVIDGDTLDIHGQRIRLHGVDAPESNQLCRKSGQSVRCGQTAALALDGLIQHRPVACEQKDKDRYGRVVAVCRLGSTDLNAWMVQQGHALAYRSYSEDYVRQEAEARQAKRGVWAGAFDYPWDWRRGDRTVDPKATKPQSSAVATVAAGDCKIKGNISAKGEKVYHTTESPFYAKTSINTSKGERWFCTEREAKAAGWRPAQW